MSASKQVNILAVQAVVALALGSDLVLFEHVKHNKSRENESA